MKIRKITYAVFFMVLMLFAMPITAYADTIIIESQGITVTTKETPTETVVIDKMEVLSDGQIQAIKDAGKKLSIYNVGLYVEMTEKASCSQNYANSLAEQKFDEFLPAENSVMIVFSFYEEAGGYYAVHYNVQGDLQENRIRQIIDKTYHQFKTDSTWIVGSFEQVIDYLTEVEYNLINADAIAEQRHAEMVTMGKFARAMLECLGIATIIYIAWEIKSKEKKWKARVDEKNDKITALNKEVKRKNSEIDKLKEKCGILQEWKKNAEAAVPGIDGTIAEYLAKKVAKDFCKRYRKATGFESLSNMIYEYDAMKPLEKRFVTLDIEAARIEFKKQAQNEAEKASKVLEEACKQSADRYNRDSYNKAMNYYNGLPTAIKVLIAAHLVRRLTDNHSAAQSDYRRHQASISSSYSHPIHTSSGFSSGGFHSGTFGGGFGGGH